MEIVYPSQSLLTKFHEALDQVAKELIYIEMTEAKPIEVIAEFQSQMIVNNWPGYYAVYEGRVVGWADVTPFANLRMAHRGTLGMGLIKEFRGQGLGTRLLEKTLAHAKEIGLEKVELTVYTENLAAIKLYEKCGFEKTGLIKHYRKLNGRYFDCLCMEIFL